MKNEFSGSPSLEGGIPLVVLADALGCLGVEFFFCNAEGTVGMASTVLVAGLLGAAHWITGGSWGTTGTVMFGWRAVELKFCLLCLGLMKLLFLLKHCPVAGISTM